MVRVWRNYHGGGRRIIANRCCVHHRHTTDERTCDIHVKHVIRVQVGHHYFHAPIGRPYPFSSILYKTKLPFILVFNKTDVQPHDFALQWMHDFEAFQEALATHRGTTDDEGEPTYMNSLMNSMSLVLDEFYKHLTVRRRPRSLRGSLLHFPAGRRCIEHDRRGDQRILRRGRSLANRIRTVRPPILPCLPGLPHLAVYSEYLPELERARAAREQSLQKAKEDSVSRLMADLAVDHAQNPNAAMADRWDPAEEEEEDEDADVNIIDRSEWLCTAAQGLDLLLTGGPFCR